MMLKPCHVISTANCPPGTFVASPSTPKITPAAAFWAHTHTLAPTPTHPTHTQQINSFETQLAAPECLGEDPEGSSSKSFRAVFIRAPAVLETGPGGCAWWELGAGKKAGVGEAVAGCRPCCGASASAKVGGEPQVGAFGRGRVQTRIVLLRLQDAGVLAWCKLFRLPAYQFTALAVQRGCGGAGAVRTVWLPACVLTKCCFFNMRCLFFMQACRCWHGAICPPLHLS